MKILSRNKKLLTILILALTMLFGCSTESLSEDFSKRMNNEEAQVSIILGEKFYEDYRNVNFNTSIKNSLSPEFIDLDDEYKDALVKNLCTEDQIELDKEVYFERLTELIGNYSQFISGLENRIDEADINYDDLFMGLEVKDENISTAYLYINKVIEIKIGDNSDYYTLSESEYKEFHDLYNDFLYEYYLNPTVCPCWNVEYAKSYIEFFKPVD